VAGKLRFEVPWVAQSVQWLGYGLGDWDSIPDKGKDFFFLFSSPRPDRLWGAPNLLSSGYQGLFRPGLKWPEREDFTST
jgi:hypothetical protein